MTACSYVLLDRAAERKIKTEIEKGEERARERERESSLARRYALEMLSDNRARLYDAGA